MLCKILKTVTETFFSGRNHCGGRRNGDWLGAWCWFGMSYILINILLALGDSSMAI